MKTNNTHSLIDYTELHFLDIRTNIRSDIVCHVCGVNFNHSLIIGILSYIYNFILLNSIRYAIVTNYLYIPCYLHSALYSRGLDSKICRWLSIKS